MNKKGVTLLELIIVMVIIAIGATLVAPNIGRWLQHYRLRSATRDIVSTMRTAQMKAVSFNTEHRVSFDINAGEYLLQIRTTQSAPNDWIPKWEDAKAQNLQQKLPPGIQLNTALPSNNAEFNPNSTSSSGSVTLRNTKGSERRIVLTAATGRIRIEE